MGSSESSKQTKLNLKDIITKHIGIKKNLELAVRCSAMAFLRLRRQNEVAMLGSLCDKLTDSKSYSITNNSESPELSKNPENAQ